MLTNPIPLGFPSVSFYVTTISICDIGGKGMVEILEVSAKEGGRSDSAVLVDTRW